MEKLLCANDRFLVFPLINAMIMKPKKSNLSRILQISAFILAALAVHFWVAMSFSFTGLEIIIIGIILITRITIPTMK
ncbi:MAG: hypothetical protein ACI9XO_004317 [Paraglaciecola sp.]